MASSASFAEASDASLISRFEAQVARNPTHVALTVEDGRTWTYAELDRLAAELSRYIAFTMDSIEVGNGDAGDNDTPLVCLMLNRDVGAIAAMLGVLKAGVAYVPVDPAFPPDRQSYIFKHSRCGLAVLDEDCVGRARALGVDLPPTIVVASREGTVAPPAKQVLALPSPEVRPDSAAIAARRAGSLAREDGGLAYVLYTSGSTGNPKGVMVKQRGVVNIVDWFAHELDMAPGKRVLGLTTFCFDISVLEVYMPLLHGATLVLAFSSTQKDTFRLIEVLEEYRVDVLQATPTAFEMLLAAGWSGDAKVDLLVGGEAFRPSLLPLVAGSRSVRNVYGPTETTIWSSSYTLPRDIASTSHAAPSPPPIPIGAPISATDFYLASEADVTRLAPAGVEGELCIGGIGVARGYLHAPDLTVGRFIPCPYPGGRGLVYRTGDIAMRLPGSNSYVFVRRMDDQVKIGGFRIELGEVEAAYAQSPLVEQAVAHVRGGRLAVYLQPTASSGGALDAARLQQVRQQAALRLTHYMLPEETDTVVVVAFPQTANGKLDRKALPDPPAPSSSPVLLSLSPPRAGARPRSMVGHVCGVFEAVRGRRPQESASFASLGVDSLGAVLFLRVLSESVGSARIHPSDVYAPGVTVRSFALGLHARLAEQDPGALERLGLPQQPPGPRDRIEGLVTGGHEGSGDEDGEEEGGDDDDEERGGVGAARPWAWEGDFEAAFSDLVASNVRLLVGLRGVFCFLVLWEHFHYESRTDEMSPFFSADTSLFVVFSGLSTALQLREPPTFREEDAPARVRGDNECESPLAAKGRAADATRRVLLPRAPFRWRVFLASRATGIFPILYLALLLNAPWWVHEDKLRQHDAFGAEVHIPGVYQVRRAALIPRPTPL